VVTKGKKIGTYFGRVAVRKTGSFNIKTKTETVQGVNQKYCHGLHKSDGYTYSFGELSKVNSPVLKPTGNEIEPKIISKPKSEKWVQLSLF
jgi:hypothetical protein